MRIPFSIHRNTVTLLTPQCLATVPVVRYSGQLFSSLVFKSAFKKSIPLYNYAAQAAWLYFRDLLKLCYAIHEVNIVYKCSSKNLTKLPHNHITEWGQNLTRVSQLAFLWSRLSPDVAKCHITAYYVPYVKTQRRREYGGMRDDLARGLKELEKENTRLKKLVAELSLDNAILKEAAQGNF